MRDQNFPSRAAETVTENVNRALQIVENTFKAPNLNDSYLFI